MQLSGPERLVLQSLLDREGNLGKPVFDLDISEQSSLTLQNVRNALQMLQEKEMVSLVFTERGLASFIEAKGRLTLNQLHSSLTAIDSHSLSITERTIRTGLVRVVVAGLTGTGKSLLINTIIGQSVMNVVSIFPGTIEVQRCRAMMHGREVELIDCPGLGSGRKVDKIYFELHKYIVAECDILLWTVRADTKIISLDEEYFEELQIVASKHKANVLVILTFCDRMQPGDWDLDKQRPDDEQEKSIDLRRIYLSGVLQIPPNRIIKCSLLYNYGIDSIKDEIGRLAPPLPTPRRSAATMLGAKGQRPKGTGDEIPPTIALPAPLGLVEVFYSYAHEDEPLLGELLKHLGILKRLGVIRDWHDRKITAGTEWKGQIDQHLDAAGVILLLVSPDFIDSDYCWDIELTRALERHEKGDARVIPVILRPVDNWQAAPFAKLGAAPTDGRPVTSWPNRDEAFVDVAGHIRRAVEELQNP